MNPEDFEHMFPRSLVVTAGSLLLVAAREPGWAIATTEPDERWPDARFLGCRLMHEGGTDTNALLLFRQYATEATPHMGLVGAGAWVLGAARGGYVFTCNANWIASPSTAEFKVAQLELQRLAYLERGVTL